MPYGLVNAPSVFQDFMHEMLWEYLHCFVLVYIDDILIYSLSLAEHRHHVAEVFQRLRQLRRFLKAEKCSFHQPSVQLLHCSSVIVEVDASTTGVGAILPQQQGNPSRLHPCAAFSRKLSPAEHNYDIGNWELLAIKLALEEWRHWLEGAKHPFTVLTDHKNLQYLREAKRLNPRQARWALFFTRFNFKITYHPGPKNIKASALSRLHAPEEEEDPPNSIILESMFVCPIQWNPDSAPSSNVSTATLPGCPPDAQYVPRLQRTQLIHSAHSSLGTGHPWANATLSLLKDRYWWPNMAREVRRFVQVCEECAISKSPHHLPAGKLLPLPVPNRPMVTHRSGLRHWSASIRR